MSEVSKMRQKCSITVLHFLLLQVGFVCDRLASSGLNVRQEKRSGRTGIRGRKRPFPKAYRYAPIKGINPLNNPIKTEKRHQANQLR